MSSRTKKWRTPSDVYVEWTGAVCDILQQSEKFGDLLLDLTYLPSAEKLTIALQRARNLRSPDSKNSNTLPGKCWYTFPVAQVRQWNSAANKKFKGYLHEAKTIRQRYSASSGLGFAIASSSDMDLVWIIAFTKHFSWTSWLIQK